MEDSKHWKILVKELHDKGVDMAGVTLETSFVSIGLDSLDMFSIVIKIEQKYNIKIDDNELTKIKTLKDAFEILKKYIK